MRTVLTCALSLPIVLAVGCGRFGGLRSKRAVEEAIAAHLRQRSNLVLANMTTEVENVKFSGDWAEAEVVYRSKESPELAVRVRYELHTAGDHWEVVSNSPAGGMGGNPHGPGGSTAPPPSEPVRPEASH